MSIDHIKAFQLRSHGRITILTPQTSQCEIGGEGSRGPFTTVKNVALGSTTAYNLIRIQTYTTTRTCSYTSIKYRRMQHNSTRGEQLYTRFELYLLMMLPSRYLLTQSERPQTHILKNAGHGGIIVFSATGEGGAEFEITPLSGVILGWGAKEIDRGP